MYYKRNTDNIKKITNVIYPYISKEEYGVINTFFLTIVTFWPKMEKTKIVNLRLPKDHIEWLDSLVKKGIYKTRSEAIREFGREYLQTMRRET
jgi:hypothetical protein